MISIKFNDNDEKERHNRRGSLMLLSCNVFWYQLSYMYIGML